MRNVSRLCLRAHTLKAEAAARLRTVLAYVTNVLVKSNMFRTRCMLFSFAKAFVIQTKLSFAKTIRFVS
jgi:hypothetical protein